MNKVYTLDFHVVISLPSGKKVDIVVLYKYSIGGKEMSEKIIREALILLHPERWSIIKTLKASSSPLYINKIAEKSGVDRRLVSYHLSVLEQYGFVESEFKIIKEPQSKGKAGRFYKLTGKVDEVLPKLAEIIKQ